MTEFVKTMAILIVAFMTVYVIITLFQPNNNINMIEGLTNEGGTTSRNGEAGSAASYSDGIKAQVVKIQDELLVSKYRKDYENTIINMDDLNKNISELQLLDIIKIIPIILDIYTTNTLLLTWSA